MATDQEISESEQCEEDEALDPGGPGPAFGEESFQHEREDNSPDGTSCACDACGIPSLGHEEVSDGCGGGRDDQGCADTSEDAEDDEKMPIFWSSR